MSPEEIRRQIEAIAQNEEVPNNVRLDALKYLDKTAPPVDDEDKRFRIVRDHDGSERLVPTEEHRRSLGLE